MNNPTVNLYLAHFPTDTNEHISNIVTYPDLSLSFLKQIRNFMANSVSQFS